MDSTTYYRNLTDGTRIYCRLWQPEGEIRGTIALVHGLGEHCSRYEHVAEYFNQSGYALLGFDLRGHGQSDGLRGHIASNELTLADIQTSLDELAVRFRQLPQFLYGHSMGGSLALFFALTRQPKINGLIVTGPSLAPGEPVPAWKLALAKLMNRLLPEFRLDNGLDRSNLSRDPQVVSAYREDPLVHPKISARLGVDLINNGDFIRTSGNLLTLPLLLMVGGSDHIVNQQAIHDFSSKCNERLTFKIWEGLYHELHNEPEKNEVLALMVDWMNNHRG